MRYRTYGNTKRAKWKAEQDAFDQEMAASKNHGRREAKGLRVSDFRSLTFALLTMGQSYWCLNPADTATSPSLTKVSQDALRVEAAHVIASSSYGLSLS